MLKNNPNIIIPTQKVQNLNSVKSNWIQGLDHMEMKEKEIKYAKPENP